MTPRRNCDGCSRRSRSKRGSGCTSTSMVGILPATRSTGGDTSELEWPRSIVRTTGEPLPGRGEFWWVRVGPHMSDARRQPWFRAAVLVGAVYALVGIVFALPSNHVRVWRLAAWAVSGLAYALHVGYERLRLRNPPPVAAWHVALAAALGAFGLAVGANLHSLAVSSTSQHQRLLLVALVAWPLITGVPAFLVGLAVSGLLALVTPPGGWERFFADPSLVLPADFEVGDDPPKEQPNRLGRR
jgi:hypothetical protein